MKRLIAGVIALALLTVSVPAYADVVMGSTRAMAFRSHIAAGSGIADEWGQVGATGLDTLYSCGNGTGLVDTTIAWIPTNLAVNHLVQTATDTVWAPIKVLVTAEDAEGTVNDLNAVTITLQGSADGYTWATLVAATSTTTPGADPQKVAQAQLYLGKVNSGAWNAYRFILTGISGTTGCMKLSVSYPKVVR